jgi:hypothetical protein
MARKIVRVNPDPDGWKVKSAGAERADSIHDLKSDAVARAKEIAKAANTGQVVIKGRDGRIQTEHTYGKDPYPPKG